MFDKVKLSNFEKVKKIVVLDDLLITLIAGLQNVLLVLAVVEGFSSPTFIFFFKDLC